VKRVLFGVLFVLGFASAGTFSAVVVAETTTTATTSTETTTTVATTTTTVATTTTTVATTTTAPAPATLPPRVRIAGVGVGGLDGVAAATAVRTAFTEPLAVIVDRSRLELDPAKLATAYVAGAVARARTVAPGSRVELVVAVRGPAVRRLVARIGERFERAAVDAELSLRNGRPSIARDRPGRDLDTRKITAAIIHALRANSRTPLRFATTVVAPRVTREGWGPVIVINRALNRLSLYDGMKPWRVFGVATGRSRYPTPAGRWSIVVKWRYPWWYPPASPWAQGLKPVPPGPGNPLGTRWMGLSASGVGIHGTPDDASIGYSASHGCIRMHIPDAEWLFNHVDIGTTVFIV
jgi:lipoprotein-anchoring transpeptidase ErfK/SrfK